MYVCMGLDESGISGKPDGRGGGGGGGGGSTVQARVLILLCRLESQSVSGCGEYLPVAGFKHFTVSPLSLVISRLFFLAVFFGPRKKTDSEEEKEQKTMFFWVVFVCLKTKPPWGDGLGKGAFRTV